MKGKENENKHFLIHFLRIHIKLWYEYHLEVVKIGGGLCLSNGNNDNDILTEITGFGYKYFLVKLPGSRNFNSDLDFFFCK